MTATNWLNVQSAPLATVRLKLKMAKCLTINDGGYEARPHTPTPALTLAELDAEVSRLEQLARQPRQSQRAKPRAATNTQSPESTLRVEDRWPRRKRCEYGQGLPSEGTWRGLEVQAVLEHGKFFVVRGWPAPISADTRVELPPVPYHPTYGPAAREEARKLMAGAKHNRINLGPYTKKNLCKVANLRPLLVTFVVPE